MNNFFVVPATRKGVKALVGFYGRSGSGKTFSALLFARGLAGPAGKIVLLDSENGRGSIFADIVPGGYGVIDLEPPFTPQRYQEAVEAAEAGADVVVVDSLSHEWVGEGGVLDMQEAELDRMAGDNWGKREACKMASWIKPKIAHKQMIMRLLRCKSALICCLRGEEKTHMLKGDDGKNKVITDQFSSPLFDSRFIFEMLLNFETIGRDGIGGFVIPRKITHPSIRTLLPGPDQQITVEHGAALAQWCANPAKPAASAPNAPVKTAPAEHDPAKALKTKLWTLAKQYVGEAGGTVEEIEAALKSQKIIGESLKNLSLAQMGKAIDKLEVALSEITP
jgi:hypothetical protein